MLSVWKRHPLHSSRGQSSGVLTKIELEPGQSMTMQEAIALTTPSCYSFPTNAALSGIASI